MANNDFRILLSIIACVVVFLAGGCSQRTEDDALTEIKALNADAPLNLDLSELVDSVSFIQLETNSRCLLGNIREMLCRDDRIFISANNGMFVFDANGIFLSEIGRKGYGPGEYIDYDTFYLNEQEDLVCLVCGYKNQILCYQYSGELDHVIMMGDDDGTKGISKVYPLKDGSLIVSYDLPSSPFPKTSQYRRFIVSGESLDSEMMMEASALDTGNNGEIPYSFFPMAYYKGELLALDVLSNIIYKIDKGVMSPLYRVDAGRDLPDDKFVENNWNGNLFDFMAAVSSSGLSSGLNAIFSDSDYLLIISNYYQSMWIWDGKDAISLGRILDKSQNILLGAMLSGCSDNNLGYFLNPSEVEANPTLFRYHFKKDLISVLKKKLK